MSRTIIRQILERISARDPRDVTLELGSDRDGVAPYRVRHGLRSAHVDRVLAVELRGRGARWAGDITRDPCAVA